MSQGKRCAITGARGYLGSRLTRYFQKQGWAVLQMSRGIAQSDSTLPYCLSDNIVPDPLAGNNALIHCAHDFTAISAEQMQRVNVEGSCRLLRAAHQAGVGTLVFVSSMSAFEGCRSLYGRAKLAIEQEAAKLGAFIVRPGTIYGKKAGGILGSMRNVVAKLPVVPLIGSGNYPLYMVHEEDLCALFFDLCSKPAEGFRGKPINAAEPTPILFRQLLNELAAAAGKKPLFVPVPSSLLIAALRSVEAIGLRIGLRSDSIVSLVHPNPSPDFGLTAQWAARFRKFSAQQM